MNRLYPVYEAIDDGKYELAIKICDKAMKKGGNDYQTLKALKALAKARSGVFQEAYDLAYEVKQTKPTDAPTIQAVFMTFKQVHMYNDIVDLYENAYNLLPGNEEWANHWFMALARKGDWKQLQQAAVKINKEFKKPKYYFWISMAVYLQALDNNAQNRSLMLTLAERMMIKAAEEGKIQDFETLQLYTQILSSCEKYENAYNVLKGPLGKLCKVETERKKMCVEMLVLMDSGKDGEIAELCTELLLENPDDWWAHKAYQKSMMNLGQSNKMISFILSLQKTGTGEMQRVTRGAFLAEVYCHELPNISENLSSLILNYVNRFGSTLCCFDDLFPILCHVPEAQMTCIVDSLTSHLDLKLMKENQVDQTRMNITILKVNRYLKHKLAEVDVSTEVAYLLDFYKFSLTLKVKDERERQYGDDYILLAVHAILDEYFLNRGVTSHLVDAIALLEYGLEKSKFNYLFKILLIRLYMELGISFRPFDLAESLEIKNIQFDTLSYIFTDDIEAFACIDKANRFLNTTLTIYDRNEIETPEMILQAFKFGTFSKISEFIDFQRRLQQSVQRAITNRQIYRLELLRSGSFAEMMSNVMKMDLENLSFDGACPFFNFSTLLSDNRDTSIIPRYTPSNSSFLSDLRGRVFPVSITDSSSFWLQLHSLIPLLYSCAFGRSGLEGFTVTVGSVSLFIESSKLSPYESMAIRILLLILRAKEGTDVSALFEERLEELQGLWSVIESKFELKVVTLAVLEEILLCLEAWNAALTLTFLEKNKSWKAIVSKQVRNAKKSILKYQNSLANESVKTSLRARLLSKVIPSAIQETSPCLDFIQKGWTTTLGGIANLLDKKIAFLVAAF